MKGVICCTLCVYRWSIVPPAWVLNSQKSSVRSAENPQALHENPLLSSKIGVWCAQCQKGVVGLLFFRGTGTAENYPNLLTHFVVLLEENKWDCCFSKFGWPPLLRNQQQMSCRTSLVISIVGREIWPPRSPHLRPNAFFSWTFLKKEPTAITQEASRNLNLKISRLLPALTRQFFKKLQETKWKGWSLSWRRQGTFSASTLITDCLLHSLYL